MLKFLIMGVIGLWKVVAKIILALACLFSDFAFAHSFLPENDLHTKFDSIQGLSINSGISEKTFNEILDRFERIYEPIIKNEFGATLDVIRLWDDPTINAYANRNADIWMITMIGGLARAEPTTPDGFSMVVCHELGHHLGGVPFSYSVWAASEGQSDYFAAISCAKKIWDNDLDNEIFRELISQDADNLIAKAHCDRSYATTQKQNLCYRIALAGKSAAAIAAFGRSEAPNFATQDTSVVERTKTIHPAPQCRLDTYLAGALCDVTWEDGLIPGVHFPNNHEVGAFVEARPFACQEYDGSRRARPRCWFSPYDIDTPAIQETLFESQKHISANEVWRPEPIAIQANASAYVALSGFGNANLYWSFDEEPTLDYYGCATSQPGINESCTARPSTEDRVLHTMVYGLEDSDATLRVDGVKLVELCRNAGGGAGAEFSCLDGLTCKLVDEGLGAESRLNWCIVY